MVLQITVPDSAPLELSRPVIQTVPAPHPRSGKPEQLYVLDTAS